MNKVYKETFELKEIPFTDSRLEIDIKLYAKGMMEFASDADEAGITSIKEKLSGFVMLAIDTFAQEGCEYEAIHRQPILPVIIELLDKAGNTEPSFEVKNMYFTELHPADEDYKKIIEARKRIKPKEEPVSTGASNPVLDEIKTKLANGEFGKVEAIKYYVAQTGVGLAEAKKEVEQILGK